MNLEMRVQAVDPPNLEFQMLFDTIALRGLAIILWMSEINRAIILAANSDVGN